MQYENMYELINAFGEAFPNATIGEDSDGQIVIYTNMRFTENGTVVEIDEECYCELCCSEGHCGCEGCNEECTCEEEK